MRVSKMTVYRLVHAGELPAVRVGRSFRVPEEAVNEYLQELLRRHGLIAGADAGATGAVRPPARTGVSASGGRTVGCRGCPACASVTARPQHSERGILVGSVIKKRRKRMAKKKHRKLLKKTRVQRRKHQQVAADLGRGSVDRAAAADDRVVLVTGVSRYLGGRFARAADRRARRRPGHRRRRRPAAARHRRRRVRPRRHPQPDDRQGHRPGRASTPSCT